MVSLISKCGDQPGGQRRPGGVIADQVKDLGGLAISTIGTSRESADPFANLR